MTASNNSGSPLASERLQALARVSSLMRAGLPAHEAMQSVLAAAPEILPADAYAIWRYHHRTHEWRIVASAGLLRDYADHVISER
ncbi:MAG TPA: hypothetical protein VF846_04725, partial [Thermoanaerobaculia bacterium]